MPNYQLGKIYQLICNKTGKRYIGATTQKYLSTRLAHHVSKKNTTSSKEIIDFGNYEMVLIESYPCSSKDELHQRERYFIETLECVNKIIPTRTQKEYNKINREKIQEYQKNHYVDNKYEILKQQKIYQQNNRVEILEKQKIYRQDNRAEILEKKKYIDSRTEKY